MDSLLSCATALSIFGFDEKHFSEKNKNPTTLSPHGSLLKGVHKFSLWVATKSKGEKTSTPAGV